jgi:tryptophan synthase alpha chain
VRARVAAIRSQTQTAVAVGFGVRDAASASAIAQFADAVVIGSALVEKLANCTSSDEVCARAKGFLAPIRAGLDLAGSDAAQVDAGASAHAA